MDFPKKLVSRLHVLDSKLHDYHHTMHDIFRTLENIRFIPKKYLSPDLFYEQKHSVFRDIFEKSRIVEDDIKLLRERHRLIMDDVFDLYNQWHKEKELRERNPELQELYEQYQIAIKLYQD